MFGRRKMELFGLCIGLCALICVASCDEEKTAPPTEKPEDWVVSIDGEKISRKAYGEALIEDHGQAFLEQFITNYLVEREAKKHGINVSREDVEKEVQNQIDQVVRVRFRGNRSMMEKALERQGLTMESWKRSLLGRTRLQLLAQKLASKDRTVPEAMLRKKFEMKYGVGGVKRKVRHIMISTNVWASNLYTLDMYNKEKPQIEKEARAALEGAIKQIKAGEEFAEVARKLSDDYTAQKGGDLGRSWKNRYGPAFDEAAAKLKVDAISGIVPGNRGFHVLQAYGKFEDYEFKARHILFGTRIMGKADATAQKAKEAEALANARKALKELKEGGDFQALARKYSDDPGSKLRGGDLGTFGRGRMVPPFEEALLKTKVGDVTDPFKTRFGYHLVQLLDKKRRPEKDTMLIRHIMVATDYNKVKQKKLQPIMEKEAKKKIEEVRARLAKGEDFAKLAQEFSEDNLTKTKGGLIDDVKRVNFGKEFSEVVSGLTQDSSPVLVKGRTGYHLVELMKVEKTPFEDVRDQLEKEEKERPVNRFEIQKWMQELRKKAKIEKRL
jgi:peptidyl-prolyl cis-trans isomerase SurA